ncbi:MAG: sulfurtransferase complex subunit TusB [Theionarchaea archaeon]|nr:sulfurtransferase complex subunit TusB [Theionarchaea archaeon]MBU6999264.1 sulfurtransferase complex subunit TusB [Theionarchaea archaeon]MBU7019611.1 sulfurtransferase complex subunit TusB [Theionarchaea archaeon]MBU7033790.1 sulfurtransferase complex subunit TusB [Theionarchaea archaeon]MBU7040200.1 sulfurtransferase complex subunit TusB [Theionarchaea archaeon]
MLFIINKSPFASRSLESCLDIAGKGDAILLIEDGVYAVTSDQILQAEERDINLYVLKADAEARGIQTALPVVDYEGVVELVENQTVVTWS